MNHRRSGDATCQVRCTTIPCPTNELVSHLSRVSFLAPHWWSSPPIRSRGFGNISSPRVYNSRGLLRNLFLTCAFAIRLIEISTNSTSKWSWVDSPLRTSYLLRTRETKKRIRRRIKRRINDRTTNETCPTLRIALLICPSLPTLTRLA